MEENSCQLAARKATAHKQEKFLFQNMLKFYGIRFNKQGEPERFSISFALSESLNAALYIHDYFQGDQQRVFKAIHDEINNIYRHSKNLEQKNKIFRFTVAKWFRTQDILRFLYDEKHTSGIKFDVARILNTPETIENKWQQIESIILNSISSISSEQRDYEFSQPESEFNLILQMTGLFFLELDDESPPANLELQFIRNQFPRIIWKKKDGFNAQSNPFWLPKNPYCRVAYLAAQVISKCYQTLCEPTIVYGKNSLTGGDNKQISAERRPQGIASFDSRFPQDNPDEIRLQFINADEKNIQLSGIPETVAETLLALQKMIQKKLSHQGVKHLLGIFRQLAESVPGKIFDFDTEKHMRLVARVTKKGKCSNCQFDLLESIFKILFKLRVKRTWNKETENKQIITPFLLELGSETGASSQMPIRKLLPDPIFFPGEQNPFNLGRHLTLIPQRLFRENNQKHTLLPGLSSFLTNVWLNDFSGKEGTAEKTTQEIIEGCAFNMVPSSKYRLLEKVNSELAYMGEKCYISSYNVTKDEGGNPWNDLHRMTAPDEVIQSIIEETEMIEKNPYLERLLA